MDLELLLTLTFIFVLSAFLGLDIIKRVSRLLHTPLMSLTNAISSIAVVGAIVIAGEEHLITNRMLGMFKRREVKK
jgi:NAD(P) transhydrogenase subunit alpha